MNKENRKSIIAGNWKMNKNPDEAKILIQEIIPLVKDSSCEVILCVPYVDLHNAMDSTQNTNIKIGAENCHWEKSGAYTGEISADMLSAIGVKYVIIGHSERRSYFGETNLTVNKRLKAALNCGLNVILCVGETLEQREHNITAEVVSIQTKIALNGISKYNMENIIIAYEPVWAIGTGKTATAQQANEVCHIIRDVIEDLYDCEVANSTRILYGGSMNSKNAKELLSQYDIDGGLIGGASLKAIDFSEIVKVANI